MELKFTKRNKTLVVKIAGEIDHHTSAMLRQETERALERMGGNNIVFHMEEVTFMDSSGIGAMIGRYKVVQRLGGRMAVSKPSPRIQEILRLSAVSTLIPSFVSLDGAMTYVEGGDVK